MTESAPSMGHNSGELYDRTCKRAEAEVQQVEHDGMVKVRRLVIAAGVRRLGRRLGPYVENLILTGTRGL